AARVRQELARLARRFAGIGAGRGPGPDSDEDESLLRWLLLAYPDRVVRRRGAEETGVMVGGRGVRLAPESIVRDGDFFLALDPREERRQGTLELQVRLASIIRLEWLQGVTPARLRAPGTMGVE